MRLNQTYVLKVRIGLEMPARVRLEGDGAERRAGGGLRLAGIADQHLMAAVHAVEIADRGRCAPVLRVEIAVAFDQSHMLQRPARARIGAGRSNVLGGACGAPSQSPRSVAEPGSAVKGMPPQRSRPIA